MKIKSKNVLEINSLEDIKPVIGISIDLILIKNELKESFNSHEIKKKVIPMLNKNVKIIFY